MHIGDYTPPGPPFFMYLLYLDASGTPDQKDSSKHYVLTGLCVHEGTWFALEKRLQGLKRGYAHPNQEFELHAAEFAVWIREQDAIPDFELLSYQERRAKVLEIRNQKIASEPTRKLREKRKKKYARTDSFIHLTRQQRSQLLAESLELVGDHKGISLFCEAVSKNHPKISGKHDVVTQAFEQVVSRFDAFLGRRHQASLLQNPRRKINNGLLILDDDYSTESLIHDHFQNCRISGHSWGRIDYVIDVPFFASSNRVSGLQLVDVCSYSVRRDLDIDATQGSPEEENFRRIFHKFDRGKQGMLHGIRHYVPANSCNCLICKERGHSR